MKAIVCDRYGGPEVLEIADVDQPVPKEGEVLVRVRAAAVNPADWYMMTGVPYLIRIMGYGLRRPRQRVIGYDVAGVVEVVGEGVTRWKEGDEVFGWGPGAFAEYACVPESQLQSRPESLTLEQASTVGIAAFTALHAIRDQAKVQAGQKVLIVGASGGVGTFAVQLAKAYGAEVTGVCSTRSLGMVQSIGADHVIDYTAEDFTAGGPRYDVVVRVTGDRSVADCRRALEPNGTLVIVGGGTMGKLLGGMERWLGLVVLNLFTRQRLRQFVSISNPEDLAALKEAVEIHGITPVLDARYPLAEAAEALRRQGEGHVRGKVVLVP